MKLITRDTDYAIRALCFIAKAKGKVVPVPELVKALRVPRPFLRKILQRLNSEKILESHKGIGGGFLLARPVNKIYLLDILKIFQGDFSLNECFLKKIPCPNKGSCILRRKINMIEGYVLNQLKPLTIASLLR